MRISWGVVADALGNREVKEGGVAECTLWGGTEVCIKRLNSSIKENEVNELGELLRTHRHPGLVTLLGVSIDPRGDCYLVLERMPFCLRDRLDNRVNSTIASSAPFSSSLTWSHRVNSTIASSAPFSSSLTWSHRVRIAHELCKVVLFLHSFGDSPVVHRNISSKTILLDGSDAVHLGGIALCKQIPPGAAHVRASRAGSFVYACPEYISTGKLTPSVDVYSVGMVMLELLTGSRPEGLKELARDFVEENGGLEGLFDPNIPPPSMPEIPTVSTFGALALACISDRAKNRPSLSDVTRVVGDISVRLSMIKREIEAAGIMAGIVAVSEASMISPSNGAKLRVNSTSSLGSDVSGGGGGGGERRPVATSSSNSSVHSVTSSSSPAVAAPLLLPPPSVPKNESNNHHGAEIQFNNRGQLNLIQQQQQQQQFRATTPISPPRITPLSHSPDLDQRIDNGRGSFGGDSEASSRASVQTPTFSSYVQGRNNNINPNNARSKVLFPSNDQSNDALFDRTASPEERHEAIQQQINQIQDALDFLHEEQLKVLQQHQDPPPQQQRPLQQVVESEEEEIEDVGEFHPRQQKQQQQQQQQQQFSNPHIDLSRQNPPPGRIEPHPYSAPLSFANTISNGPTRSASPPPRPAVPLNISSSRFEYGNNNNATTINNGNPPSEGVRSGRGLYTHLYSSSPIDNFQRAPRSASPPPAPYFGNEVSRPSSVPLIVSSRSPLESAPNNNRSISPPPQSMRNNTSDIHHIPRRSASPPPSYRNMSPQPSYAGIYGVIIESNSPPTDRRAPTMQPGSSPPVYNEGRSPVVESVETPIFAHDDDFDNINNSGSVTSRWMTGMGGTSGRGGVLNLHNPLCLVCISAPRTCMLVPCRHAATCYPCGLSLKMCPICRQPVTDRVKGRFDATFIPQKSDDFFLEQQNVDGNGQMYPSHSSPSSSYPMPLAPPPSTPFLMFPDDHYRQNTSRMLMDPQLPSVDEVIDRYVFISPPDPAYGHQIPTNNSSNISYRNDGFQDNRRRGEWRTGRRSPSPPRTQLYAQC